MDPLKDWLHIWIQQNLTVTYGTWISIQNKHVDKEYKVSKDALQKSNGQIYTSMKIIK